MPEDLPGDLEARRRALDAEESFIVQAPAGSGKTELLIQRFLRLLETVETPEAVVAITFTKKAAAEMRTRVLQALRTAASRGEPGAAHEKATFEIAGRALEHERRLGWNLLANPARLRIETIDALCASITRQMPWLARFGAPPEVTEKAQDLYREAAQNTLARLAAEPPAASRSSAAGPISNLLLHLDNDFGKAQSLIAQMLEKRDQWLRLTGVTSRLDLGAIRRRLEHSLEALMLKALEELRSSFDEEAARDVAVIRELDCLPSARLDDIAAWRCVADLLLTKEGEWRRQVNRAMGFPPNHKHKRRCEDLLARIAGNAHMLAALQTFRALPDPCFDDAQWRAMEAVLAILPSAVAELQMTFRERGLVDFAELAIRAAFALGTAEAPTDLALSLGYRIQHLLVDEFQDTSYSQYELLTKLTAGWQAGDGRTLFLVGDPMQSIYRFRQAEVSLFLQARAEGVGATRLRPLQLTDNFRSRPELVEWANATFGRIFPAREDIANGAVAFSASRAGAQPPPEEEALGVEARAFFDMRSEAGAVVSILGQPALRESCGRRTAILVRARAHLSAIVPALKQAGIRFQAIEIDELGRRPVIQDLMALTFAALHPADRVSWLAILRAPWCGLSLEDLHVIASANPNSTIRQILRRADLNLSDDARARLRSALPILAGLTARRGRMRLRERVESAWLALGGPACIREESGLEDAGAYFDLMETLEAGGDIEDFANFRQRVDELFAQPDAGAGDAVQVMTIHKAKGLEFDTVILPALGMGPRSDDGPLLVWQEQGGELLLAPISATGKSDDPIYRYLRQREREKDKHETARMLYVAATRARKRLHLLACVTVDAKSGRIAEPRSGSFLNLLWPSMREAFAPQADQAPATPAPVEERRLYRVPSGWTAPPPPRPAIWSRQELEPIHAPPITFEWAGDTLRHVGTAVHGYLQRIAREGLEAWSPAAVRAQRRACEVVLANLGASPGELDWAAARVEAALLHVLGDERGRWLLAAHAEAACEYSVTGLLEGKLCQAAIDRTFVDQDGVRWIVDYKTSVHEGGGKEAFIANEKRRHQEQLERYARLLAQIDPRPIRLGLYFPLLNGWCEWEPRPAKYRQASLF